MSRCLPLTFLSLTATTTFFFFQFIDKKTEELAFLEDEYQRALADIGLGKIH